MASACAHAVCLPSFNYNQVCLFSELVLQLKLLPNGRCQRILTKYQCILHIFINSFVHFLCACFHTLSTWNYFVWINFYTYKSCCCFSTKIRFINQIRPLIYTLNLEAYKYLVNNFKNTPIFIALFLPMVLDVYIIIYFVTIG